MSAQDPKDPELIAAMGSDPEMRRLAIDFVRRTSEYRYSYNFSWLGRPVIQYPTDVMAMQEIIWATRPDVIIETGVAHGGMLVFYASMLQLLGEDGIAIGVDVDIRPHNRIAIGNHPLAARIRLIEGSSVDDEVVGRVRELAGASRRVLVTLDSMHTREHVLRELQLYSPLVHKDGYLVVFDTSIEDMPEDFFPGRPWSRGNSPRTAVRDFLAANDRFEVDREIENKLLITVAGEGFLRCVRDPQ